MLNLRVFFTKKKSKSILGYRYCTYLSNKRFFFVLTKLKNTKRHEPLGYQGSEAY